MRTNGSQKNNPHRQAGGASQSRTIGGIGLNRGAGGIGSQPFGNAAPPPFDPSQLSGLQLWLDGDNASTSTWTDSSSNHNDLTGHNTPTVNAADPNFNGKKTVSFAAGSSQYYSSAANLLAAATAWTIVVCERTAALTAFQGFVSSITGSVEAYIGSDNNYRLYNGSGPIVSSGSPVDSLPHVVTFTSTAGGSGTIYLDGVSVASGSIGTTGGTGTQVGNINGLGDYLSGTVATVLIYNRVLTPTEIGQIDTYLNTKYAVTTPLAPLTVAGMQGWWRSDVGITLVSGGVSNWADQSFNGNPMSQATVSYQPIFNASDGYYNNKPTLLYDKTASSGGGSEMAINPLTTTTTSTMTFFIVGETDQSSRQFFIQSAGARGMAFEYGGDGNFYVEGGSPTTVVVTHVDTSPSVFGMLYNTTASKLFISAKTPIVTGGLGDVAGQTILWFGDNEGAGLGVNGKMAEIIMYYGALSQSDINKVLAYLGGVYNIAIGA
jgi:hypothetical protein